MEYWLQWIAASIARHFATACSPLPVYSAGEIPNPNNAITQIEIQIRDFEIARESKTTSRATVQIVAIVKTLITDNSYKHDTDIGNALKGYSDAIPVYKYGTPDDVENTGEYLGCLQLNIDDGRSSIEVLKYGKIDPTIDTYQASINAQYEITLENGE